MASGRGRELCSNECLKAWAKKEKERDQVETPEEEVGISSPSFSSMTTPPSSMSPSSGNGVSPSDKALSLEVAAGRKGRLEAICLYERGQDQLVIGKGSSGSFRADFPAHS